MPRVTKAVILAAGLGTRMLPATKAVPKEMLPIVDKPLIQYTVEEAVDGGIDHIIFVIAEGKEAIHDHFGNATRANAHARTTGDTALAAILDAPTRLARFDFAYQPEAKGIAHAVACAREFIEGEPFVLMFPDDLMLCERSAVAQLVDAYQGVGGTVLAVQAVAPEEVHQYGIVDPVGTGNPVRLRGVVEKPAAADAPSNLAIVGRYILSETILAHIDKTPPGKNGELQITDAIASQIAGGEMVSGLAFEGTRYDTGRPTGYLVANVAAALRRSEYSAGLRARLAPLLAEGGKR
jgi:UTP--glucose-1-phosphate uridylyltransferase